MKHFLASAQAVACLGLLVNLGAASPSFNSKHIPPVVIFGDSYTDQRVYQYRPGSDGEVAKPANVTSTGGRVWPEYVHQYSKAAVYDYAVSGAVCDSNFASSPRNGVKQAQIPAFLEDQDYFRTHDPAKFLGHNPDAVYAIWIGTNDIGNGVFFTDSQPAGLSLTSYVDCVFEQLDRLYAVGARKFVLMNIAPLELSPQYATPQNGGVERPRYWPDKTSYNSNLTQISEKMRQYSTLINDIYRFQIPFELEVHRRYRGSHFALFDVHSLLSDVWHHPSVYLNGSAPLNVTGFAADTPPGNWDSFMWYDELHPSEQTDRVIAKQFVEVLAGRSEWTTYW
ncbi:putative carbohydrate acetylesterase [Penicillium oxalicum 114-2]|uniref:Putative carbohydrate acetylesterase n=1 Tax=Penicillium oxalicum (strain 114-2 / CGMCC 5302) TaxID=933388 RepID=S7ZP23_PENO1|nr:putative carbohydrate acetylesterase [Penicillium oxalicum 114-2]